MRIVVSPNAQNTHNVALVDGFDAIGLILAGQWQKEVVTEPARVFSEKQDSLTGGQGRTRLVEDNTAYAEGHGVCAHVPYKVFPQPVWRHAEGIVDAVEAWDGSVTWEKLDGYISVRFTTGSATYRNIRVHVRQVGKPSTLTIAIRSNSGGVPGSVIASKTVAADGDAVGKMGYVQLNSDVALNGTYHLVLSATATSEYWLVGCIAGSGKKSQDGTTWENIGVAPRYRIAASADGRLYFFTYDGALYAISSPPSGAPRLWINGNRGKATAATSSTLTDANYGVFSSGLTDNMFAGWRIQIVEGTGEGQTRKITANDDTTYTISPKWDVTPNATSRYVVYGGNLFTEITGHGLTHPPTCRPLSANKVVYFLMGKNAEIRRMRENTANANNHEFAGTAAAWKYDIIARHQFTTRGVNVVLAKAADGTYNFVAPPAWGGAASAGTSKQAGTSDGIITSLYSDGAKLFIGKSDGLFMVDDGNPRPITTPASENPSSKNFLAVVSLNDSLFCGIAGSFGYVVSGKYSDILKYRYGFNGLPDGHDGHASRALAFGRHVLFSVDAGSGRSAIYAWNGLGLFEVFCAPEDGTRIRDMYLFPCPDAKPQLWIDAGGDALYMTMPSGPDAEREDGMAFMPEAHFVTSTIDAGSDTAYKSISRITLATRNLDEKRWIEIDYQIDDKVETNEWKYLCRVSTSPHCVVPVMLGKFKRIRFRYRMYTTEENKPAVLESVEYLGDKIETPRYRWTGVFRVGAEQETLDGQKDFSPGYIVKWLRERALQRRVVRMLCEREEDNNVLVTVSTPAEIIDEFGQEWSGRVVCSFLEAG